METIGAIKQICSAITTYETSFEKLNRLSLNEAIILQTLHKTELSASVIAKETGLSASNASKVLSKLEKKWLIQRVIGKKDKRVMNFSLTSEGKSILSRIKNTNIDMPSVLEQFVDFLSQQE